MNLILRRCLAMLDLTLIKRDYFDSEAAENIPVNKTKLKFKIIQILLLTRCNLLFCKTGTQTDCLARLFHIDSSSSERFFARSRN